MTVPIAVIPQRCDVEVAAAVVAGGGVPTGIEDAAALVWTAHADTEALASLLASAPTVRWVHLLWAGVSAFGDAGLFDDERAWTCGKGAFARPVAEHALALALACLRQLPEQARARRWGRPGGVSLVGRHVTILGGGAIAEALLVFLSPFACRTTVVRRDPSRPTLGAARTWGRDRLDDALAEAEVAVVAAALTPDTYGIIDAGRLAAVPKGSVLVNVARGEHVVTNDLVAALRQGQLGGAGLDVTDPEPLPEGHPLWTMPNTIVTPHTSSTPEQSRRLAFDRIVANVRRFAAGRPLLGAIDPARGY